MMKLNLSARLLKIADVEYDYATTQAIYDAETTRDILDFVHEKIKPDDVYENEKEDIKGKEDKPHITLLYGIKERKPNVEKLTQMIQNHPALTQVAWVGLDKFEADQYDVLIIKIESKECEELFADLNNLYPDNANSYPDYKPHTALAYVQRGKADSYIEEYGEAFVDPSVQISKIEFEFNGEVTQFDPMSAQEE